MFISIFFSYINVFTYISLSYQLDIKYIKVLTGNVYICLLISGNGVQFSSVQSLSHVRLFATPWTAAHQASWSVTNSWSLLKLMSIESVMLSNWCSSSVGPFSSHLQTFPASRSFQMSQFFISGGQSIGVSASASVLQMNIQGWFPLNLTSLISCIPRDSQESSPTPQFESINSSALNFFILQLSHPHMTTGKTIALTRQTLLVK